MDALPRQRWAALDDQYELLGELGRGGMADVFHARDRSTGDELAVKIIHARTAEDDEALARFAREARTAARLEHPNIVPVIATRELADGSIALVMPYVPGETLRERLRRTGPQTVDIMRRVLRDVAGALASAHAAGIVHRDVKPENIFIDRRDGRALLSDFGIARAMDSETVVTRTGMSIGTPAYMSPEQIDGRHIDGQSDLYSLGLVGWEMASGTRPWAGESLYSVIYKQINEELPPASTLRDDLPRELALTIDGALIKDRASRWSSAEEMLAQLEHADAPVPSERGARIAALVAAREAMLPGSAYDTAVFRRPAIAPVALSELDEADLALVRRRPVGRWIAVPVIAAAAVIIALAVREGTSSFAPSRNDSAAGRVTVPDGLTGAPSDGVSPPANASGSEAGGASASRDSLNAMVTREVAESLAQRDRLAEESSSGTVTEEPEIALTLPAAPPPGAPSAPVESRVAVPSPVPASVLSTPGVTPASFAHTVAAGGTHSCYVTAMGELFCWGGNDRGQVGSGNTARQAEPVHVASAERFRSVSAGVAHSCALTNGGAALCWGANDQGQLGDGTQTGRVEPVRVAGGLAFREVRAGMSHSCALATSGEVFCWGSNAAGQLGNGGSRSWSRPVRVESPERFVSLAVGWNHACALTGDGRAFCWGQNAAGQLGDGSSSNRGAPVAVAGGHTFSDVAAGGTHSCAIAGDGEAYCWGRNSYGQLGDGSTEDRSQPVRVSTDVPLAMITAGSVHSCALARGGQAHCWGRNSYGQLGDGGTGIRATPVRVLGGHGFSRIDATGAHTCALTGSGEGFCWGYNVEGQLGDRTRAHRGRPVYVDKPSG